MARSSRKGLISFFSLLDNYFKIHYLQTLNAMFYQSFVLFIRNLLKDKVFSFIVIANLVAGFATFILISQFIHEEFAWEKHNLNYNRIYRVQLFMDQPENVVKHSASVTAAFSRHDLLKFPEIEKIVLMHDVGDNNKQGVFLSPDKKNQFLVRWGYFTDQSVFNVFTFRFLEGDSHQALTSPNSIVLSKEIANKLFPDGPALGRQVYGENKVLFTVTGVYDDIPINSEWRPRYLLSMLSFTAITGWKGYEDNYWAYSFYTYVLLRKNADPKQVDEKIYDALKDYRKEHHPYLLPMSRMHVDPYFESSMLTGYALLSFIALLILVLSSTNFINLQIANATKRLREIGIKKAVGFSKKQLLVQFMLESFFTTAIAGLVGVLLAHVLVPVFNRIFGNEILTSVFNNISLLLILGVATLVTGLLSGLYPSFVVASFNPVGALKQRFAQDESNGFSMKKVLVTLQFSISIFLLIVSFIIYRQAWYMANRDMGFNSHDLLFANIVTNKTGSFDPLRQRLLRHPEIADACFSDYIPYILPGGDDLSWEDGLPEDKVFVRYNNITYDYVSTFGMKIVQGRNFSRDFPADRDKCLINETAARVFEWDDPVGKHIHTYPKDIEVIGVIRDYILFSVNNAIEPSMYRLLNDTAGMGGIYTVRFKHGNEKAAADIVKEEFEAAFPDDVFDFKNIQFLIRHENAYIIWTSFKKMCMFFAIISILISSIGLFGLIMFFARRKMKEIGIRKVLGFTTNHLYYHMSSGFIKLLIISLFFAWPAAYFTYKFLPGAYKYGIQVWEFLLASAIVLIVALATISYQIVKAARTRPVDVLKDE